jgi:hypothetical protein
MEKLLHVKRLRLTDELQQAITRYMALDDRESFDETVRHLLRVGLETRMGGTRKSQVVERADGNGWNGQERRRSSR